MNIVVTTRAQILMSARSLAAREGLASISIRAVAAAEGISVGSIYNYFPSKADLMIALVDDIWRDILPDGEGGDPGFAEAADELFQCVKRGSEEYPAFFAVHPALFGPDREGGRRMMEQCFAGLNGMLLGALKADERVDRRVFADGLTEEALAALTLQNILANLASGRPTLEPYLGFVKKLLYDRKE